MYIVAISEAHFLYDWRYIVSTSETYSAHCIYEWIKYYSMLAVWVCRFCSPCFECLYYKLNKELPLSAKQISWENTRSSGSHRKGSLDVINMSISRLSFWRGADCRVLKQQDTNSRGGGRLALLFGRDFAWRWWSGRFRLTIERTSKTETKKLSRR